MFTLKTSVFHIVFHLLNFMTLGNLPPFAAVSAIIEQDGSILLIDRSDGLGLSLPGGMMKWRESIEAALRREVQEETGFTVAITRLVGIYSGPYRDPRVSSVQIVYAVAIVDGQGKSSPEGRISWVPKDIMPDGLAFDHTAVMTDYLSGEMRLF